MGRRARDAAPTGAGPAAWLERAASRLLPIWIATSVGGCPCPPPATPAAQPLAEGPAASVPPDREDVPEYLRLDDLTAHALRARPSGEWAESYELVVVEDGLRPKLLFECGGVRIAHRVDPSELATVARRQTRISAPLDVGEEAGLPPVGVYVRPGQVLSVREGADPGAERVAVSYTDRAGMRAQGVVARSDVGHTFIRGAHPLPMVCTDVVQPSELRAAPEGPVLARCEGCPSGCAQRVGPGLRGYVPIRYMNGYAQVIGFVPEAGIASTGGVARTRAFVPWIRMGHVCGRPGAPAVALSRGTLLYERPGGAVVGLVRADARMRRASQSGEWIEVVFDSPLGELHAFARPPRASSPPP